jgi:dihydropteroate synthase
LPGKIYFWKLGTTELHLGVRTLIMGVLNVTPDSFSDGGKYNDPDRAYARALELEEAGADIIDIGAESTRPGSHRISAEEEWRRLVPVLKRLKGQLRIPISLDTYKSETAERAFEYGVEIVNDPSGLTFDPNLAKVVAQANAGFVLNHMRGSPETWGKIGPIPDVMGTVARELEATAHRAQRAGVDRTRIVLDPGLGFGKRKEQNSELISRLGELVKLEYPILVGPSRKSFIARGTEEETAFATAAAVTAAILQGAHLVRVHDVAAMHPAIRVADEIVRAKDAWSRENEGMVKVKRIVPAWTADAPRPVKPTLKTAAPPPPPQELGVAPEPTTAPEPATAEEKPRPISRPPAREDRPSRQGRPRDASGRFSSGRESSWERPPRRFDGPPGRTERPRRDGPPGREQGRDPRDGPRRYDGPPRESRGGFRRSAPGGSRRDGPPGRDQGRDLRDGPRRYDGPPREGRGAPRGDGPPGRDRDRDPRNGPRGRYDGPPRESRGGFRRDGPPSGPRRDGPPRGPRPGGDRGGKPPYRSGGKPPRRG